MLELTILLGFGLVLAANGWSQYLKHQKTLAELKASQESQILAKLHALQEEMTTAVELLNGSTEKQRAILKGFIDSMTDIVKLSEEDKANLQNRLVAAKLGKKV